MHEQDENIMRQKLLENPDRNSVAKEYNNWIEKNQQRGSTEDLLRQRKDCVNSRTGLLKLLSQRRKNKKQ